MNIPPIKEDRLDILLKILDCIEENKFNRESMKNCILKLYPQKSEKSVFRGIAIPTLRRLGLILGYSDLIRPSSNGRLLSGSKYNEQLHQNIIRAVFLEIDNNLFGFIDTLKKATSAAMQYKHFDGQIEGVGEYKRRWLKILSQCGLIELTKEKKWNYRQIFLLKKELFNTEINLNYNKKVKFFKRYLFRVYEELPKESAGIIDIEKLRGELALRVLKEKAIIITKCQFDCLLNEMPLVTNEYMISLGQPMGAEEKLFEYKGKYYSTLSIYH